MLRHIILAVSLVVLAGCSDFRERFSSRPTNVVAEAGGQRLTAEQMSQWMASGRGLQPTPEAARFVAELWVNHALFAQAAVNDKLPSDSAGIAQAMWSELAALRGGHWHDTLAARRGGLSPGAVDSAYGGDDVRVLQHILFRAEPSGGPAARTAAKRKAQAALTKVRGGADFGALAARLSEDPGSQQDAGFLPPSPRGRFVPAFDSAGWALAPGAVSGVVETPFGYHIIKRPGAAAVRERLAAYLKQSSGMQLDSVYMDSLAHASKLEVKPGATVAMRTAVENPEKARRSKEVLVSYKGGALTVADFNRWLQVLPPQYSTQLRQAPDSVLQRFAKVLAQNVLVLRQADSAGIAVTPAEWAGLAERYRTQVDTLRQGMGLAAAELGESKRPAAERNRLAAQKVDEYFDQVVAGTRRLQPIPPALAAILRERGKYRIHETGLNRALELAKAAQAADSAQAAGPLQPAPGGPPIPGASPAPPADGANKGSQHEAR